MVEERPLEPVEPYPIAVCTPMYNSSKFLNRYLFHLTMLDYPRDLMSLFFTIQGDDNTFDTMKMFRDQFSDEYRRIKIKRVKQVKGGILPHVRNVCQCRNLLAKWSNPLPTFFIDHDNFPPPVSIRRLQHDLELGADIAAGIYAFCQRDKDGEQKPRIRFTAFFIVDGDYYHIALSHAGRRGYLARQLMGKRFWADSVAMGTTLIRREVLDKVRFEVPWENIKRTDDTHFCINALKHGFKIIADFGLFVPHWGFNLRFFKPEGNRVPVEADVSPEMADRRTWMERAGVYNPIL